MQFIITLIIVSIIAALSACGGGSGMADANLAPNGYTAESGLAQKGPLMQGSQITINELSTPNFQPTGRSFSLEVSSNDGKFNPSGIYFVSPYLSTSALGYYFNEISGLPSSDVVFLRGLSDLSAGADTVINVNALSSISKSRILNLVTGTNLLNPSTGLAYSSPPAKLPFGSARTQAQAENLKAFYIYNGATLLSGKNAQPANFTALDLSQNRAADQILAAFSAVAMTAGQNGNGVNTLLSQIEADFADDGLLNNSPKYPQSVSSRLCAAAAGTNFAAVAANLNNFYGTKYQPTDLSQWVDTSGCVDQVIDKYKFSASNVAAGTVSKSPAYIVGPDDVGQCFSVGALTGTATAGLYYNGAANPVAATQLAKLGDRMELGLNVSSATGTASAFIQRSAPVAYGTCPVAVPTGGVTRVQRYRIPNTSNNFNLTSNGVNYSTLSLSGTINGASTMKPSFFHYLPNGTKETVWLNSSGTYSFEIVRDGRWNNDGSYLTVLGTISYTDGSQKNLVGRLNTYMGGILFSDGPFDFYSSNDFCTNSFDSFLNVGQFAPGNSADIGKKFTFTVSY